RSGGAILPPATQPTGDDLLSSPRRARTEGRPAPAGRIGPAPLSGGGERGGRVPSTGGRCTTEHGATAARGERRTPSPKSTLTGSPSERESRFCPKEWVRGAPRGPPAGRRSAANRREDGSRPIAG